MSSAAAAAGTSSIGQLLDEGCTALRGASFAPSLREAALLLGHVLGRSEAQLRAFPERSVDAVSTARFRELLRRRLAATPVAYLLGEREFWGRSFAVDPRVLIPRPETEHLVEAVLALDLPVAPRILDVGTGSGCLAVTLAAELAEARVVATDLSPAALALARRNALRHGVADRVGFVAMDLLAAFAARPFDLLLSNPPYIAPHEAAELSPEISDHEPHLALFGEGDGTGTLDRLLAAAGGLPALAVEVGAGQSDIMVERALRAGWKKERVLRDLAGIARTLVFSSGE